MIKFCFIEIEDLETNYSRKKGDSHMLNLLREHYTQPLNYELGQSVLNHKWSELLYHTNRYMQRGSLMENYAIRKMQEQIICQVHNTHSIIQVLHTSTTMLLLYINWWMMKKFFFFFFLFFSACSVFYSTVLCQPLLIFLFLYFFTYSCVLYTLSNWDGRDLIRSILGPNNTTLCTILICTLYYRILF